MLTTTLSTSMVLVQVVLAAALISLRPPEECPEGWKTVTLAEVGKLVGETKPRGDVEKGVNFWLGLLVLVLTSLVTVVVLTVMSHKADPVWERTADRLAGMILYGVLFGSLGGAVVGWVFLPPHISALTTSVVGMLSGSVFGMLFNPAMVEARKKAAARAVSPPPAPPVNVPPMADESVPTSNSRFTHCYRCLESINSISHAICHKCGWIICPHCAACGCQYWGPIDY